MTWNNFYFWIIFELITKYANSFDIIFQYDSDR